VPTGTPPARETQGRWRWEPVPMSISLGIIEKKGKKGILKWKQNRRNKVGKQTFPGILNLGIRWYWICLRNLLGEFGVFALGFLLCSHRQKRPHGEIGTGIAIKDADFDEVPSPMRQVRLYFSWLA